MTLAATWRPRRRTSWSCRRGGRSGSSKKENTHIVHIPVFSIQEIRRVICDNISGHSGQCPFKPWCSLKSRHITRSAKWQDVSNRILGKFQAAKQWNPIMPFSNACQALLGPTFMGMFCMTASRLPCSFRPTRKSDIIGLGIW